MNEKEWEDLLTDWETSGKSQNQWCRENNIRTSTFGYWKRKLRTLKKASKIPKIKFKELSKEDAQKFGETAIGGLVIQIGVAKIEVSQKTNTELLKMVIKVLKTC